MADDLNNDAVRRLKEEADLRRKIAESSAEYLVLLKDIKAMHKNIATIEAEHQKKTKEIEKLNQKIKTATGQQLDDLNKQLAVETAKEAILRKQVVDYKESAAMMTKIAKETRGLDKSFAFLGEAAKDVGTIARTVKSGYGLLKNWAGLFEIDKSIRTATLSMGLLDKRGQGFRDTLKAAGNNTISFGIGIKELASLQANFSEELGRSVLLSQNGLEALGEMAAASNLGAEGAAKMTAEMQQQGLSAERTRDFVEQTMNDASKMGLNASKVVKNIQQNMKLLNRYNFKGGVKGLAKMAETTSKLGVDMTMVTGMADKLFDIEGAVDMSAQLQVLGGAWSQLADPFHLMYMARNDMEGLTEEIANAAGQSARFNSANKDFEISALEMHRLRKVAEQTGMDYDQLATAAKNAAQFTNVRKQIHYGFDKATKEFIENTATFNEKGEAEININGQPKLVKQLNSLDKTALDAMVAEKKTMKERAEAAQTFDEKITNLINQIKQMLLPVLEGIDKGLRPILDKFSNALKDKKFYETIQKFGETIGGLISTVGKFIYEHPVWSLALFGVFEAAKWIANGVSLGIGFNRTANVGGGSSGGGSSILDFFTGGKNKSQFAGGSFSKGKEMLAKGGRGAARGGRGLGGFMKGGGGFMKGGGAAIAGELLGLGADMWRGSLDNEDTNLGKGIGIAGEAAKYAGLGAMFGPWGALAGGLLGAGIGTYNEYFSDDAKDKATLTGLNDGIVFNEKDKFLKMNDGAMIAGTNVNGNKDLAKALTNESTPSNVKIEFGEIHFKFDELKVTSPGHPGLSVNVLDDPIFIRNLTRIIHVETEKVIDGGKVKPK